MDAFSQYNRFVTTLQNKEKLAEEYSRYLERILQTPKWPKNNGYHVRIPWWMAIEARNEFGVSFLSAGLYLFGAKSIPRYIGRTEKLLWSRLKRRYILKSRSQCVLAQKYSPQLIERGVSGFPAEIIEWCNDRYNTSVRLEGAVDFARHGIMEVWFSLIPAISTENVRAVEKALIPIANNWNKSRSYPLLLNKHHTTDDF